MKINLVGGSKINVDYQYTDCIYLSEVISHTAFGVKVVLSPGFLLVHSLYFLCSLSRIEEYM